MKRPELIAALQEECRVDRRKAEDFLNALGDICGDALVRGEIFNLGAIGIIWLRLKDGQPVVRFCAADKLRKRLGTVDPKQMFREDNICPSCKERPRTVLPTCNACRVRAYRSRRKAKEKK